VDVAGDLRLKPVAATVVTFLTVKSSCKYQEFRHEKLNAQALLPALEISSDPRT
jgi:hypothetical protein